MSFNEKMTAIANAIRDVSGKTDKLSLDDMPREIGEVCAARWTDGYHSGYQEGAAFAPPDDLRYATKVGFSDLNKFGKSEVVLNVPFVTDYYEMIKDTTTNTTVEHLTINGANDGTIKYADHAFYGATDNKLQHITLNCDFSKCENFQYMFGMRNAVKIIDGTPIDFSSAKTIDALFLRNTVLETMLVIPNSIKVSLDFSLNSKLSNATIQSIFDGLATVSTTKTLSLSSSVKILQAQYDSARNKGWTVYGGTIVTEEVYYG